MSRQNSEAEENEKLCYNKVFMLRHKTLMSKQDQTTSAELCRDIAKLCRDRIQEESMKICRDRNCRPRQELSDKDENYVATELSMSRQSSQLG